MGLEMKLKLAIIHLDMVIETLELEPGEYTLGRSSRNNIVVQHFSLAPEHGKIFSQDDQWFYENNEGTRKHVIDDSGVFNITDHIGLASKRYVERGDAKLSFYSAVHGEHQAKLKQRLMVVLSSVAALLLVVGLGYLAVRSEPEAVQQSKLINRVRDKIVEFEANRDEQAINDFKKYAGLSDADFKDTSGFCTGFLVGPNVVLTAAHCLFGRVVIDLNNDFYLKTSDGERHQIRKVLGFDVKRDFLFLETEGMEKYGHLNFAESYEIEQKVFTIGNVHGEGIAIRDGIISSETADLDEPDVTFLRYSAGTSPGNSGGPLLNKDGDVVALVFAATNSENFNMGTPSKDLMAAYEKFVENSDQEQTVELAMKRVLNFRSSMMLQALSLPYLPQFDEYPETSQLFNEVSVEIKVPMDFSKVDELVLSPLNTKVIETFYEVQSILQKKNEIVLDWKSFVTPKTPTILPSQFDMSQRVFNKIDNRYYPQLAGLIDSPSKSDFNKYKEQLKKENKFDFQAYGYNIELSQEKVDLLKSDVFYKPKNESGAKERLGSLSYGAPNSQLLVFGDNDLRTDGFFGIKLFLKNFIGKQGVISSTSSRFVRPAAVKDFTIREVDIPQEDIVVEQVEDRLGRNWRREWVKLFEATNLITYCMELPEGTLCIARMLAIHNDHLFKIIENNFRKFILSHLLINPYFWEKQALVDYLQAGKAQSIPLMNGVSLQLENSVIKGAVSHFPFRFEIPEAEKIESLRLQTGLYGGGEEVKWTGYGLEWVQREEDKDLVCGLGLEAFGTQSAFILNYLRDRRKQEKLKKIKGEDPKPLPGVWYKPFRGLKDPFQIYGYCAPLEEDPRVAGQYFVDFKNSKPLKYKHNISQ
jgi:hypothetical protein